MGQKKKGKDNNKHQGQSFQQMISEATLARVKSHVSGEVQRLGMSIARENENSFRGLYARLMTLEKIIMEKFEISDEQLAHLVADTEDAGSGLERVDGEILKGDVVRLMIATKAKDQAEFQGESPLIIEDAGNEPFTIGPELEPELLGMKPSEEKDIPFGKDKGLIARITISRISRKIIAEPSKDGEEKKNESNNAE